MENKLNPIEKALVTNDLSQLNPEQRISYYKSVCDSVGLNPLTQPLAYIQLNGKICLYAKRDATDQLRKIHGISINITSREKIDDVYIVTAKAKDSTGREDESIGSVSIGNLKGDALANAYMKCETKAKRRVTLSICGLGLLDETEVETIPGAVLLNKQITAAVENEIEAPPAIESPAVVKPTYKSAAKTITNFADQVILDLSNYEVRVGRYTGKRLGSIGTKDLERAVDYLNKSKETTPLQDAAQEFLNKATSFLELMNANESDSNDATD